MVPYMILLTEESLISILKDRTMRASLVSLMRDERSPAPLVLHNQLAEVSPRCVALSADLVEVFESILADEPQHHQLLEWLVFHPEMPEQLLLQLASDGKFITQLGHRGGPQTLLEFLAREYKYDEAITTLALSYYAVAPASEFRNFVTNHRDCWMMRFNLAISLQKLDAQKSVIVKELFESEFSNIFARYELIQALRADCSPQLVEQCLGSDDKYIQKALLDLPDLPKSALAVLCDQGKTKAIRNEARQRLKRKTD